MRRSGTPLPQPPKASSSSTGWVADSLLRRPDRMTRSAGAIRLGGSVCLALVGQSLHIGFPLLSLQGPPNSRACAGIQDTRHSLSGRSRDAVRLERRHSLAYQALGEGPDLLYLPGGVSNVDVMWESSDYARLLRRFASFSRLIVMDRRGTGCSDRFSPKEVAPLEVGVEDAIAVLDDVGSARAAVFAFEEPTFIAAMVAAARSRPDLAPHPA